MPGPVSDSYKGPGPISPYVPEYCYDPPGPLMCACGHHEGYHNDAGHCLLSRPGFGCRPFKGHPNGPRSCECTALTVTGKP